MDKPKISIVIPVHKVEPYLRKCLDSVISQTYLNMEIILIDDGSPDRCGVICDEYAKKDGRIHVIHQRNQGLSAARNVGLAIASGEYIGFVDSDDWVEPDMFEYLLENIWQYRADIAICGRREWHKGSCVDRGWHQKELLNTETAMRALLKNDVIQNYVWDKLWRRELFEDVRFPVGKTFEDIAVVDRLFTRAGRVICLPDAKYNYLIRPDSILGDASLGNKINYYLAAKSRYESLHEIWPQFSDLLAAQCAVSTVSLWGVYYLNAREERAAFKRPLQEISVFCGQHYQSALQYMNLGVIGRAVLRLTPHTRTWAFALAAVCNYLYKCRHGRNL